MAYASLLDSYQTHICRVPHTCLHYRAVTSSVTLSPFSEDQICFGSVYRTSVPELPCDRSASPRLLIGCRKYVDSCTGDCRLPTLDRLPAALAASPWCTDYFLAPVILLQDEWAYETPTGTMQCRRHQGSLDATEPSLRCFQRTTDILVGILVFLGKCLISHYCT